MKRSGTRDIGWNFQVDQESEAHRDGLGLASLREGSVEGIEENLARRQCDESGSS